MLSIDPVQFPTRIKPVSPQITFLSRSPYPSVSLPLTFLGTAAVAFAMPHLITILSVLSHVASFLGPYKIV